MPANVSYFDSFLDREKWMTDHNALDQMAVSVAQFAERPLALLGGPVGSSLRAHNLPDRVRSVIACFAVNDGCCAKAASTINRCPGPSLRNRRSRSLSIPRLVAGALGHLHTVRVTPPSEVIEVPASIDGKRIKSISSKANNVFIAAVGRGRNAASVHGIDVDGRTCLAFAKACQNLVLKCQQLR
jgi:hypothetical protein